MVEETKRRLFLDSVPRIKKCLSLLNEEQIWQRPNKSLSSIGNLILHLDGNVRQWIGSGLGKMPDNRKRNHEFDLHNGISVKKLEQMLDSLEERIRPILKKVTKEELLEKHDVQGFEETGIGILVHVIEHFSYHTGQISWQTKILTNKDLGYYANKDLNGGGKS